MLNDKSERLHHTSYGCGQGELCPYEGSDFLSDIQLPFNFHVDKNGAGAKKRRVLSLFSGCGGMDLGFEGGFIANAKSFPYDSEYISNKVKDGWVMLKPTMFTTVFANDILPEAEVAWTTYMARFGHTPEQYHRISIVDKENATSVENIVYMQGPHKSVAAQSRRGFGPGYCGQLGRAVCVECEHWHMVQAYEPCV